MGNTVPGHLRALAQGCEGTVFPIQTNTLQICILLFTKHWQVSLNTTDLNTHESDI